MDKRIFGLGYARPRPWRESMSFSVKGPNWRGRLLSAAVEYLKAEMTPNVEFSGGAPLHGAASAGTQG